MTGYADSRVNEVTELRLAFRITRERALESALVAAAREISVQ